MQDRSCLHYLLGLAVRWKQHFKYERAVRIARKRGAVIGENVTMPIALAKKVNANFHCGNNVSINTTDFSSFRYPIYIGNNVIIGDRVRFTMGGHNIDSPEWEHCRKKGPLIIDDYVWLCPMSHIMPSCEHIGMGAVVSASAVVVKNINPMSVVGGNPATEFKKRECVHSSLVVESLLGGDYKAYREARNHKK